VEREPDQPQTKATDSTPIMTASGPFFWLSTRANRSFNRDCAGEATESTGIGGKPLIYLLAVGPSVGRAGGVLTKRTTLSRSNARAAPLAGPPRLLTRPSVQLRAANRQVEQGSNKTDCCQGRASQPATR
jgi:hypothetical protein